MIKKRLPLILILALAGIFAVFLPVHTTHADLFGISSLAGGVIGYVAFGVIYIITTIAAFLMSLLTYEIAIVLQLSNNIVNTFAVQTGFTVTLAVANLGFVLAIIIIAIATILHRESYGIKSTLWRLVVAAVLVNFSLVIGGAIINFGDTLTNSFLAQLPASNGLSGAGAFAQDLAGAFAPQRALLTVTSTDNTIITSGGAGSIKVNTGDDIAALITPLVGIFSAAALLIVIIITLAVFLIMLLIRYVTLAFLLILMPFAWLLWLFPSTKKHWSSWWNEFIRWTFFAPIVVFFLWLAIATAKAMHGSLAGNPLAFLQGTSYQPTGNPLLAGVSSTFGTVVGNVVTTMLQGVIVVGLAVGGMYVANKLSITGAGAGIGAMKSVGRAVGNYAGRRGRQVVTAPIRGEKARQRFSSMQQHGNLITRWAGRIGEGTAVWGGEKATAGYAESVGKLTRDQALNQLGTSNAMRRQAILARANKEGWHDDARLQKYLGEERKEEMKRYGGEAEKNFDELRVKSTRSMIDAINKDVSEYGKKTDTEEEKLQAKNEAIEGEFKKLAAKNPEAASVLFMNTDGAAYKKIIDGLREKGIDVPPTLVPENMKKARREVVKSFGVLSQTNAASLLTEISKKNDLEQFKAAVNELRSEPPVFEEARGKILENGSLVPWIQKGSYRTLIDLKSLYDIQEEEREAPGSPSSTPTSSSGGPSSPKIVPPPGGATGRSQEEMEERESFRSRMEAERERLNRERGTNI